MLAAAASAPATADVVTQASIAALQPQISRDAEGFSECGVRAFIASPAGQLDEYYDFTIAANVQSMKGFSKVSKYLMPKSAPKDNVDRYLVKTQPASFWIVQKTEGKQPKQMRTMPGETPGSLLALYGFVPALDILAGITTEQRMQISVRYPNDRVNNVVVFSAKLGADDAATYQACMDGLLKRIQSAILKSD
jgi:hypothetical protein